MLGLGWKSFKTHDGNPSVTKTPKFGCQKGLPKPLAPRAGKVLAPRPPWVPLSQGKELKQQKKNHTQTSSDPTSEEETP